MLDHHPLSNFMGVNVWSCAQFWLCCVDTDASCMGLSVELQQQSEKHPSFTYHLICLTCLMQMKWRGKHQMNRIQLTAWKCNTFNRIRLTAWKCNTFNRIRLTAWKCNTFNSPAWEISRRVVVTKNRPNSTTEVVFTTTKTPVGWLKFFELRIEFSVRKETWHGWPYCFTVK